MKRADRAAASPRIALVLDEVAAELLIQQPGADDTETHAHHQFDSAADSPALDRAFGDPKARRPAPGPEPQRSQDPLGEWSAIA